MRSQFSLEVELKMKLQNILGLLLATAALSACGGKDKVTGEADGAVEMAPSAAETAPQAAEIMPPSAEPEASNPAEGVLDSAADKAGEMMKEGAEAAEGALDTAKDKAKEAVTN